MRSAHLLPAGVLVGVLIAFAPHVRADEPEKDRRVCGVTEGKDGEPTFRWCITMKAPNACGAAGGQHCDETACWCGDEGADVWPGADRSGLPLVAREAEEAGHECTVATFRGGELGDCGVVGWICDADGWCQDSADHGWHAERHG